MKEEEKNNVFVEAIPASLIAVALQNTAKRQNRYSIFLGQVREDEMDGRK
jgi:hypothetical protein